MSKKQKTCPLCGRDMTAIETHPGRGELYCGHCDLVIGGNEAKTPEELMALCEQVVRCRDCKHFVPDQSDHELREKWWCNWWNTDLAKPDTFCAWGERDEDE